MASKRYNPEAQKRRGPLLASVAVLLAVAGVTQAKIDPGAREIRGDQSNTAKAFGGLNNEFLLLPLLGFKEAAAGLLWVRCDEFFHSGDYDAILPLVRLITFLDPHADNVYVTGAWHLSYNFTDSSERSDFRYVPPAMQFLREGIQNNMNIPDIKFELGWENYDKVKDFVAAEQAFKMTLDGPHGDGTGVKGTDDYPYAAPLRVWHILAHTYEKQGRLPEAIATWDKALARGAKEKAENKDPSKVWSYFTLSEAEKHNRDQDMQRWRDRYTSSGHDASVNASDHPGVLGLVKGPSPKVWDVAFVPKIDVVRRKVLKISGQANMADGGRIDVLITDWNYVPRPVAPLQEKFTVDQSQTILHDAISVRKNHFEREMDMSKDPKMYSFSQPFYKVILSFNARTTAPHIQDRFGYSGEGMTDANTNHVVYEKEREPIGTKMIDGQGGEGPVWDGTTVPWGQFGQPARTIRVVYKLSLNQILGVEPITDKDIVPNP